MSEAATYQQAVTWLEDDAARRFGLPVKVVRPLVAREVGVAPGTLENVRKGRTKGLRGWIERKIDDALVRALKREAARIDHELVVAQARRDAADRRPLAALVAARADVTALLGETAMTEDEPTRW